MVNMQAPRRQADRYLLVPLVLLALAVLIVSIWGARLATTPPATVNTSAPAGPDVTPLQPDSSGYEYLVTEERYAIRQDSGELEVQERRRESWRAADGWTWARQTGTDPGTFIFKPYTEWEPLRRSKANVDELEQALRTAVAGTPASKVDNAEFNFLADMFGVESLPAGALPIGYRKAIIVAMARNDSVTLTQHARDPLGRDSIRLTFIDAEYRPDLAQSIYLDHEYQYLAYTATVQGSQESGSKIITERHQVSQIPDDMLAATGGERVEKAMWD